VPLPDFSAEADITIVGAGAAGLATAAFIGQLKSVQNVTLLDSAAKPGAKILISGGSRCNVTNVSISELDFWGGHRTAVRRILRALPVADTVEFFNRIGVHLHEEADGKLFPTSNRARDVLSALLGEVARVGVVLRSGWQVLDITRIGNHFHLTTNRGLVNTARVVLATGGRSLPKSGSDGRGYALAAGLGHSLVTTTPGLAPLVFETNGKEPPQLSGVAHAAELTLWVDGKATTRLRGQLLWTHFGVSGPVALNMSRHWARARLSDGAVRLTLNCCPGMTFDQVDERLLTLVRERPRAAIATLLSSFLPAAIGAALAQRLAIDAATVASQLTRDARRQLAHALVEWPLPVADTRGYTYAEVTAGGVSLDEIDPSTMESRVCPGLHLVGEILDVDGRIGGFNFQWAWSTAYVAARGLTAG